MTQKTSGISQEAQAAAENPNGTILFTSDSTVSKKLTESSL
jgi:hypothetical protein